MRIAVVLLALAGVGVGLAFSLGCCQSPAATSLPEDESTIRVVDDKDWSEPADAPAESPVADAAPAVADAGSPPSELGDGEAGWSPPAAVPNQGAVPPAPTRGAIQPAAGGPTAPVPTPIPGDTRYRELEIEKVKGGEIAFAVRGAPEQVLAMLVDFPNAAGHRAWAESYRVLDTGPAEVLAEWKFRGKLFQPTVHILFRTQPLPDGGVVRFELRKKQLGVASFFGDYRVTRLPGTPPRCRIVARTFIDSGISFRPVKREEIEKGLREDARLIRAWMEARTR